MQDMNTDRPLKGRVAIVTGASRGAGRGIAVELGAAGATVYVTGRSTRAQPADSYGEILALSGPRRRAGQHRRRRPRRSARAAAAASRCAAITRAKTMWRSSSRRCSATKAGSTCS